MLDPLKCPDLLTPAEMGEADRMTIAGGTPGLVLMEAAGLAVADEAARLARSRGRIVVLCGPGNNGGDGFVAARLLGERFYPVELGLLGRREALKGDAAAAAARFAGPVLPPAAIDLDGAACVIDALFGAGLARDIEGDARALVERINAYARTGGRVLAVDTPSGVDGATGKVRGAAVEATASVTFFRLKPGHLIEPGRSLCGAIRLADIGIPPSVLPAIAPSAFVNGRRELEQREAAAELTNLRERQKEEERERKRIARERKRLEQQRKREEKKERRTKEAESARIERREDRKDEEKREDVEEEDEERKKRMAEGATKLISYWLILHDAQVPRKPIEEEQEEQVESPAKTEHTEHTKVEPETKQSEETLLVQNKEEKEAFLKAEEQDGQTTEVKVQVIRDDEEKKAEEMKQQEHAAEKEWENVTDEELDVILINEMLALKAVDEELARFEALRLEDAELLQHQSEAQRITAELLELETLRVKGKSFGEAEEDEAKGQHVAQVVEVSVPVSDISESERMSIKATWLDEDPIMGIKITSEESELQRIEEEIRILEAKVEQRGRTSLDVVKAEDEGGSSGDEDEGGGNTVTEREETGSRRRENESRDNRSKNRRIVQRNSLKLKHRRIAGAIPEEHKEDHDRLEKRTEELQRALEEEEWEEEQKERERQRAEEEKGTPTTTRTRVGGTKTERGRRRKRRDREKGGRTGRNKRGVVYYGS